jgi:hypothetical protein
VYVIPRLNPDGAEICLTTPYRTVGNGRYLPWEEHAAGSTPRTSTATAACCRCWCPTQGRVAAPEHDPRLLVQREPGEVGGAYYRLLPEGVRATGTARPSRSRSPATATSTASSRSFWGPEYGEYGAGELPLVEPEAAALARFVLDHPNIAGVQAYHSHGAIILRPSSERPDADLDPDDLDTFKTLGAVGTRLTGYPVLSTFESFTPTSADPRHGGFTEWCYQHLGLVGFTNELWNVEREVGLASGPLLRRRGPRRGRAAGAAGLGRRTRPGPSCRGAPFDHPQLGEVLIGGWDPFLIHRNPPPALIAQGRRAERPLHHPPRAASPRLDRRALRGRTRRGRRLPAARP